MVDSDHLHWQPVLPYEALRGDLGVGLGSPDLLVATKVGLAGEAKQPRKAGRLLYDRLGGPDTLGDLRAVIGGDKHQIADARPQIAGVEVEQAAVTVEAHRTELTHTDTLRAVTTAPNQ
jgi:hypothetical protein